MAKSFNHLSPKHQMVWAATYAAEFQRLTHRDAAHSIPEPAVCAGYASTVADRAVAALDGYEYTVFEAELAKEPKP